MSAKGKLRILSGEKYATFCPGCQEYHIFDSRWSFNGNYEQPTFTPSLLITTQADPEFPEEYPRTVCHSFLTEGAWHFLGDCTHELRNQTVPARDENKDWLFAEQAINV